MNGTVRRAFPLPIACAVGLSLLLGAGASVAQSATAAAAAPSENEAPLVLPPEPPAAPEKTTHVLELSVGAGLSVATIQTDGAAATGFLVSGNLAYHQGLLLVGARFDNDPGVTPPTDDTTANHESRSGWHLGFSAGPSFALNAHARLDLSGEIGLHHLEDNKSGPASSYATSASLPYFGLRPAISTEFGQGQFIGAVGADVFFRVDAGQKQPNGLPDDGGHQLGIEAFLSLRIALFGGS